jgi:hypothetical protein
VLIAWLAEYPELRGIRTGWPAMKFNTALSFVLIGLALARPTISIGYVAAVLGMLLAGLTLLEYLLGINLTIDDLIVRDTSGVSAAFPGRIPLSATIMFLLLYIAMVFQDSRLVDPGEFADGFAGFVSCAAGFQPSRISAG